MSLEGWTWILPGGSGEESSAEVAEPDGGEAEGEGGEAIGAGVEPFALPGEVEGLKAEG